MPTFVSRASLQPTQTRSIVLTLFTLSLVCGISASAPASPKVTPGSQLWASQYNGGTESSANVVSPDGTKVFVTGSGSSFPTVAYKAGTGRLLWNTHADGDLEDGKAIGVAPGGTRVFVTGTSDLRGGDYGTVAYDASTGAEVWVHRYDAAGFVDASTALKVAPDGSRVFVTGYSVGGAGQTGIATIAYDATTGSQLWVSRYDPPGPLTGDVGEALAISPDGSRIYVTGHSTANGYDALTVAYDAPTGTELWASEYNVPPNGYEIAEAISTSPDGSTVYVAGNESNPVTSQDFLIIAYDALTGDQKWVGTYNSSAMVDLAFAVQASPDGSLVFATGDSGEMTSTVAFAAATGVQVWAKRLSLLKVDVGACSCLQVSPDGRSLYVAASVSGDDPEAITVDYQAATGQLRWIATYNGAVGNFDGASSLALTPKGGLVFMAGTSTAGGSLVFATVAYVA